jgi:5-formyltetrahydrofolate cyclo-ligase
MQSKASLRQKLREDLKRQSRPSRRKKSLVIGKKLLSAAVFRKAATVCFYVSKSLEVDTRGLIRESLKRGKRVLVPRMDAQKKRLGLREIKSFRDLKLGAFGVLEPVVSRTRKAKLAEVDCVVVPGVGFDKKKNRLGHGLGFYDRFLARLPKRAKKISLAFSFQVVNTIPHEAHDVAMDKVLTEKS